jgi:hypothetical protein
MAGKDSKMSEKKDTEMKEMSLTDARKHCEYMAAKGRKKKMKQQNKVEKNIWEYRTTSMMQPLSDEGRDNYERIFGHK